MLVQMLHQNFKSSTKWTVYNLQWMIIIQLNYGCWNVDVLDILRQFIASGVADSRTCRSGIAEEC